MEKSVLHADKRSKGRSNNKEGGGGIQGGSKIDARSINSATLTSLIGRPSDFSFRGRCFIGRGGKRGRGREAGLRRKAKIEIARRVVVHRPAARRRSLTDFSMFKKVLKKKRKKRKGGEEMV